MRTLELHAPLQQIQRSSGRSSVAAAAYRSGTRLEDERTGLVHDYTKKQGVDHSRIYIPDNAPPWARDRSKLWNAAEVKENRSNSCTAMELEISFPAEFNTMQRREAGDTLCRELMRRYGCAVDISYHLPPKNGDERNHHAHILFTSRGFDASTKDGWSKTKYRDLSKDKITVEGEKTTRGRQEVLSLRAFAAGELNRIARRDKIPIKTEHLNFEARGVDREPTQHRGQKATDMERKGKPSRIGDINRQRQKRNAERAKQHAAAAIQAAAMVKKTLSEQWAHRKRVDLEGQAAADKAEMSNRHKQERQNLDKRFGEDTSRKTVEAEINSINIRLQATGIKKIVRDVFKQTATDKTNLANLKNSLEKIKGIEEQKRFELQERQRKEREQFQQKARQQKIVEEQKRKQASSKQNQSDSKKQKPKQREDLEQNNTRGQPKPKPPPPRETLRVVQNWAESTGQNAREVSKQVENRKIDTSNLKVPAEKEQTTTAEPKKSTVEKWARKQQGASNDIDEKPSPTYTPTRSGPKR